MLTIRAMEEMKWADFPVLRKALENKEIPDSYYGLTSISDNMFEALGRLVEIAVLAREHRDSILEVAESQGKYEMYRDLQSLIGQLEGASSFFREQAREVQTICGAL